MKFLNNSKFNNSINTTYTNINNSNSTNVTNNNNNNSNNNHSFDISDLVKRFCNPPAKPIRNNCKLDIRNIAQWLSYTSSVAYTFGKNAKKKILRVFQRIYCLISKQQPMRAILGNVRWITLKRTRNRIHFFSYQNHINQTWTL